MDSIGNLFGSLWKGISGMGSSATPTWQKALGLGTAGFGTVGNILGGAMQNRSLSQQLDLQKQMANLTPQQMATQIQQLERPMSAGLTAGVGNSVQAQLAERGLGTSPGIFGETLSQALAPFYLQQQQMATQAWMQKLGIPAEYAGRFFQGAKGTDTSAIWKMLLNKNQDPLNGLVNNNGGGFQGASPQGISPSATVDNNQAGSWDGALNLPSSLPQEDQAFAY